LEGKARVREEVKKRVERIEDSRMARIAIGKG